jgi:hypothetical protein
MGLKRGNIFPSEDVYNLPIIGFKFSSVSWCLYKFDVENRCTNKLYPRLTLERFTRELQQNL